MNGPLMEREISPLLCWQICSVPTRTSTKPHPPHNILKWVQWTKKNAFSNWVIQFLLNITIICYGLELTTTGLPINEFIYSCHLREGTRHSRWIPSIQTLIALWIVYNLCLKKWQRTLSVMSYLFTFGKYSKAHILGEKHVAVNKPQN